ncbi:MAG TPA: CHAD domain-containing protein [Candidatus Kryptonia bacterium]|nr:CHAD domain-containing protein [Candidatus Kryptonia bacterium]
MAQTVIPAPLEIEAKLLARRAADLRAIARLERLGRYRLRPRDNVRLKTLYLDTAEMTLARHGVALRVRRDAGRWEATAKWAGPVNGLMHERPELTVPLATAPTMPFDLPAGPLRNQLIAMVAGRPLRPILLTQIQRRRLDVLPSNAGGEPVAELALDQVRLSSADRERHLTTSYHEVEIEARHGSAESIAELGEELRSGFDLTPSPESKFARGLALLSAAEVIDLHPPDPVLAGDPLDLAVRKIVGEQLRRLRLHDPGTRSGTDPEALHDFRVAVRRLRAAMRLFEAGIPTRVRAGFTRDLEWLGDVSSAVRDLDVQLATLADYRTRASGDQREGLAGLAQFLQSERVRLRAQLLKALDSARYLRLLVRLEHFALTPPSRAPHAATAYEPFGVAGRRALGHAFTRLLNRGRKIGAVPRADQLHGVRIRAKWLRYLLEFLADFTGKRGRRLVKRLVRLQDLLGAHHDAVVAAERVRAFAESAAATAGAPALVALGVFIGQQQGVVDAACSDFHRVWRRFAHKRTEKDLREIQRRLSNRSRAASRPSQPKQAPTESIAVPEAS